MITKKSYTQVDFGKGSVGIWIGVDAGLPAIGLSELEEPREIGSTTVNTKQEILDDLHNDGILMRFHNEEGLDTFIKGLVMLKKKAFSKEDYKHIG